MMIRYFNANRKKQRILSRITGENNLIEDLGAEFDQVSVDIHGNNNLILIHKGAFLKNVSFHLYGDRHKIIIGENCRFNEKSSLWAEDHNCTLSIGKDSTFEGVHLSVTEPNSKLLIGEDCMFSYDIDVRTGDSHSIISKNTGGRLNHARDIIFGNHVWVASHCIFTKGACMSSHSVVGTGSLVNKVFKESNVVVAGHPARIINRNVDWLRERIYDSVVEDKVRKISNNKI